MTFVVGGYGYAAFFFYAVALKNLQGSIDGFFS